MPKSVKYAERYVGFFPRLAAFLIDWVILSILLASVQIPRMVFALSAVGQALEQPLVFSYSFWIILSWLIVSAYFIFTTAFAGKTPGKALMQIEVVGMHGGKPDFFSIFYRETIGRYLSSLFFLGYLMAGIHRQKCALHDLLANTRVVYSFQPSVRPRKSPTTFSAPSVYPSTSVSTSSTANLPTQTVETASGSLQTQEAVSTESIAAKASCSTPPSQPHPTFVPTSPYTPKATVNTFNQPASPPQQPLRWRGSVVTPSAVPSESTNNPTSPESEKPY